MLNRTLIALSLLTIQLNAESIDMDNQSYPPQELTQMKRNDVVSLNASLVLYKLLHDGTTYLVTNNDVANIPDRTIKQGKEKCVGAEYKPGFNVGFRIQPQNDEFDYRASWTYYRSSVSSKTTTDGSNFVIEPTWLVPSLADSPTFNNGDVGGTLVLINSLKADVSNITHWIDGDVGRYFRPLGTVWIGIRPHAGFRWFMTRDQLNLATQRSAVGGNINFEPFNDRSYLKNNYWGIGPRMGAQTEWGHKRLPEFQIYANAAAALILGEGNTTSFYEAPEVDPINPSALEFFSSHKHYNGRMMIDMEVGLMWERIWDKLALAVKVGYENHHLHNGARLKRAINESPGKLLRGHGDLQYSGFIFGARIDY